MVSQSPAAALGTIKRLEALYRGESPAFSSANAVERARFATELYARHFVHAIPFPRAGLRRAWGRCESGAAVLACLDARREAERRLTSLDASPRP